jgi:hypothetical protein
MVYILKTKKKEIKMNTISRALVICEIAEVFKIA